MDSLSFVYDNTRGRMRYYPFFNDNSNSPGIQSENWDVVFRPEIIVDNNNAGYSYSTSGNEHWFDGGTIDYFPFPEANSICSNNNPVSIDDYVISFTANIFNSAEKHPDDYLFPFPAQFCLTSNLLKDSRCNYPAGFKLDPNNTNQLLLRGGIKQTYFVNKSFNMLLINNHDKIIYNPSEVTLDPDAGDPAQNNPPIEVIFPEGYTFKTVLGRYPSRQQVDDANNDPQNGGYYSDLRQVPVPVNAADLTPVLDPINYPEVMWDDPTTPIDDRYGYYYVEDKATLTVERCVRIFDAIFKVNEGGTLRFNHYPGILGFEDTHSNDGRYKIIGNFGAVLRNYKQVQYVQNGNITQTLPLDYIATEQIIAGKNVDIDNDQAQGDYKIFAGANVTFTAGNYIHLQDGFSVQGGDFHAVIDENMYVPLFCDQSTSQGGNRISNQKQQVINNNERNGLVISPNPNTGSFKIELNDEVLISSIIIYDAIGKQVFFKSEINSPSYALTLSPEIKGILFVHTTLYNGEVTSSKIAVH